jgi:hypothetical protein
VPPRLVDEMAATDPDPGPRRRRGCREQGDRDGGEQCTDPGAPPGGDAPPAASAQAGTFSGARTFRENVIAPSSSEP